MTYVLTVFGGGIYCASHASKIARLARMRAEDVKVMAVPATGQACAACRKP